MPAIGTLNCLLRLGGKNGVRGGGLAEGVWSGWAESVDNSCGRMNDGGSSLVGSVRSSPTRDAPSEINIKFT